MCPPTIFCNFFFILCGSERVLYSAHTYTLSDGINVPTPTCLAVPTRPACPSPHRASHPPLVWARHPLAPPPPPPHRAQEAVRAAGSTRPVPCWLNRPESIMIIASTYPSHQFSQPRTGARRRRRRERRAAGQLRCRSSGTLEDGSRKA